MAPRLLPSHTFLSGPVPALLPAICTARTDCTSAAAKYRPASAAYSWLGKWSWGWKWHWGGSYRGAEGLGRKHQVLPGQHLHKDPFRLWKLKDPENKDPVCVSPLALPGAHFRASWEPFLPSQAPWPPACHRPPNSLQRGMLFLRTWPSSSLSWSLMLYLPTPVTSQTRSWPCPYFSVLSFPPHLKADELSG